MGDMGASSSADKTEKELVKKMEEKIYDFDYEIKKEKIKDKKATVKLEITTYPYPYLIVQSEAMKLHSKIFKFSDTFGSGNFYFNIAFNGIHWYDFAYEYLYNSLPLYFPANKRVSLR